MVSSVTTKWQNKFLWILVLQLLMLFYSLSGVLTKLASGHALLSMRFLLCYGGAIGVLFLYALVWQVVLKRVPLSVAYANRAITVAWSLVWGVVIFQEKVSLSMVIGTAVMAVGIYFVVTSDE